MITFRPLRPDDFPTLLDWLQRPHVKQWWDDGDDTIDKVAESYATDPDNNKRFIGSLDGEPIGYFQYVLYEGDYIGADQFLCDGGGLSEGLGTTALQAFLGLIVACEAPQFICVDPHPDNARAIRCYEKCGFVHDPKRSDAAVWFMVLRCR